MYIKILIGLSLLFALGCNKGHDYQSIEALEVPLNIAPDNDNNNDNKVVYKSVVYHVYNDDDYKKKYNELKSSGLKLWKFKLYTANWCQPCNEIKETTLSWPEKYPNNIAFFYIHFDDISNSPSSFRGLMRLKAIDVKEGYERKVPHLRFNKQNFFGTSIVSSGKVQQLLQEVQ